MSNGPIQLGNVQSANVEYPVQGEVPSLDLAAYQAWVADQQSKQTTLSFMPGQPGPQNLSGEQVAPTIPVNPYAPTGWKKRASVEFDFQTPTGQHCRLRRLEKNDIFRLKIVDHLDSLLPLLVDLPENTSTEKQILSVVQRDSKAISNITTVLDIVLMACCVSPQVTNDKTLENENATPAIVYSENIDVDDKAAIFAAAFGSDMQDLKSLVTTARSVESLPTVQTVQ